MKQYPLTLKHCKLFLNIPIPLSNYKLTVYPAYNTSNKFDSVLRAIVLFVGSLLDIQWHVNKLDYAAWSWGIMIIQYNYMYILYHALMTAWLTESRAWGSQGFHRDIHRVIVIAAQQDNTENATKSLTAPCLHRIHQVCSSWHGNRTHTHTHDYRTHQELINTSQTAYW